MVGDGQRPSLECSVAASAGRQLVCTSDPGHQLEWGAWHAMVRAFGGCSTEVEVRRFSSAVNRHTVESAMVTVDSITTRWAQLVRGEFLEVAGLWLTRSQVQYLWGLDSRTCNQVLEELVEARFLQPVAGGFVRAEQPH